MLHRCAWRRSLPSFVFGVARVFEEPNRLEAEPRGVSFLYFRLCRSISSLRWLILSTSRWPRPSPHRLILHNAWRLAGEVFESESVGLLSTLFSVEPQRNSFWPSKKRRRRTINANATCRKTERVRAAKAASIYCAEAKRPRRKNA